MMKYYYFALYESKFKPKVKEQSNLNEYQGKSAWMVTGKDPSQKTNLELKKLNGAPNYCVLLRRQLSTLRELVPSDSFLLINFGQRKGERDQRQKRDVTRSKCLVGSDREEERVSGEDNGERTRRRRPWNEGEKENQVRTAHHWMAAMSFFIFLKS
ncbi:hypothetical protein Nepgr_008972 [Nepenthes gracilis]|uniref:Uncharacterized protein n=1 Tax=Nepenthes gracilis TaxID=150966 RepID=A0AAD3S9X7_NEPGR|nr:hypothetical protein Nepgr_008972 [Nepenthes gracilis]